MYDFDRREDRRHSHSMKWDVKENELPMWVADMDFKTAPEVIEALRKRVEEGIFGYSIIPDEWYEAICSWWERRHEFRIEKEWLTFCTGVIPAVTCAVKRITNVGDNVLVQTPVYDIFFHSIENHGRHVLENPLKYDGTNYSIDYEDLEKKLAHPLTTMMILCNPHNPVGRVWNREELARIAELCKKHHVVVLSDEIHCDLTLPGYQYVPFASVSEAAAENSITCISASKAFNLAGLQSAAVMTPGEAIRNKMVRGLNSDEIAEPNAFAVQGIIAAFTKGEAWLEELRSYLAENKQRVETFISEEVSSVKIVPSRATYLLWLDCSQITGEAEHLCSFIRKETGLYLTAGKQYRGNGKDFIRMNIACPKAQIEDALARFKQGITAYGEQDVETAVISHK